VSARDTWPGSWGSRDRSIGSWEAGSVHISNDLYLRSWICSGGLGRSVLVAAAIGRDPLQRGGAGRPRPSLGRLSARVSIADGSLGMQSLALTGGN
jgi:hypothetical protein